VIDEAFPGDRAPPTRRNDTGAGRFASLHLEGRLEELSRLSVWTEEQTHALALLPSVAQRLDLCLTELVTNVLTHGIANTPMSVELHKAGDALTAVIEDQGIAFDPTTAELPSLATTLAETPIGGLGIRLVRKLADALQYERNGETNRLTLVFRETRAHPL
jgi:serine/threonine-protein kinase RsbW